MVKFNFFAAPESELKTIKDGYAPRVVNTPRGNVVFDREGVVMLPTETWVTLFIPGEDGAKQVMQGKFWTARFELQKGTAASFSMDGVGRFGVSNNWPTEWQRKQALHNLKFSLRAIVFEGARATAQEMSFGNPISNLLERIMDIGLDSTAEEILNTGEWRLNGAGLKILVSKRDEGYRIFVQGDQYSYYPISGPAFNKILAAHNLQ